MTGKPVVALDLDGTLGDYHAHFIAFAQEWSGRAMPPADKINPGQPLHRHLGMGKQTYRACKLAFRQGGLKRSMPAYEDAAPLTRHIRKAGAEVWLCTTRPYLRYDRVDPDTRHWLRRNCIQYDGLLYGEHKYSDLVRIVGRERVLFVLDDLPEMCDAARRAGLHAFIRTQPYNMHWVGPRIDDLQLAFAVFDKLLSDWRKGML